ncbi:Cytochrome P450 [Nannocystis exedens]|uniref:Cytochrome P450 n=1 Tax=Nannocystis exedens TaxID=54 RepID=A0A1I1Y023_9BACT|nr:cytochrome P450 [Nannocystis exedens]PCC71736.1 cytochrome P450 [Nannocystis exedens]SFE13017.1 Cytochrome P450 [Nannocystis exedens]
MSRPVPGPRLAPLAAYRFAVDPYGFFAACSRRYGDPFAFHLGGKRLVVTGQPELARIIFTMDPDATRSFGTEHLAAVLGRHSLIVVSGERHRRDRKLLTPPFHGARMRSYGAIIREATRRHAGAWRVGEPFVMQRTTQAISLEVIVRAVFGVTDPERTAEVGEALVGAIEALHPSLLFSRVLQRDLGPLSPWRRFAAVRARAEALTRSQIAARRAEPGDDILSLMLAVRDEDGRALGDDELVDELHTLLFAGHETTAIALAWAISWLLRAPSVFARLRAELVALGPDPDYEAVAALPYLDAVCHEVLRLWPILPMAPRTLVKPLQLGRYELAPGTGIAVGTALLHQDPTLYPDPHVFRPERFLGRKVSPFEFTPFGGGHRRCIGAAFALYEMKQALAVLVPEYDLRLVDAAPPRPVRRNLSLGPLGGVRVVRAS